VPESCVSNLPFELVLESARLVAPRVRELSFRRADGAAMPYLAGQFVTLLLPHEGKDLRRSYSIATVPGGDGVLALAASHVEGGRATALLFGMEPGARVKATGPYGRFVLRDDPPGRYLLIATGTGVTPYRAMLPELALRTGTGRCEVDLLLGVRTRAELLYADEFAALAAREPRFRFHPCLSREPELRPGESRGHVQDQLARLALAPAHDVAYLCGNPAMVDAAFAALTAAGFPSANVRREKYVSSN
jgi:ferredoxin-NADP reductase